MKLPLLMCLFTQSVFAATSPTSHTLVSSYQLLIPKETKEVFLISQVRYEKSKFGYLLSHTVEDVVLSQTPIPKKMFVQWKSEFDRLPTSPVASCKKHLTWSHFEHGRTKSKISCLDKAPALATYVRLTNGFKEILRFPANAAQ